MSLRFQIFTKILAISILILGISGYIALWQARQSVTKEIDASIHLVQELISLGVTHSPSFKQIDDFSRIASLRQTRHLRISLKHPDGKQLDVPVFREPPQSDRMPPEWFTRWVQVDYPVVENQLTAGDGQFLTLIIEAQPLDEVKEVWQETLTFWVTILMLIALTVLSVKWVLDRALSPIGKILDALKQIEKGSYNLTLSAVGTKELDDIVRAVNHMTRQLNKTQLQNRSLTQHSLTIEEEERQRLSQELHDEFGQSLTAIKVMSVTAALPNTDVKHLTESISGICDHLMEVLRSMMKQLHPLSLTELGLEASLEEMIQQWGERHSALCFTLECSGSFDNVDPSAAIQVFRIVQECLTNTVRHAEASNVMVRITRDIVSNRLCFDVLDDGKGCDLEVVRSGFGLLGMQERVRSLNGELNVISTPGKGLRVLAWIPMP